MKGYITLCFILLSCGNLAAQTWPDITQIIGQSRESVDSILGQPESCEQSGKVAECRYKKGQTFIFYAENRAQWVRIEDTGGLVFNAESLTRFGLQRHPPSKTAPGLISWSDLEGFKVVSFTSHDLKIIASAYFENAQ